MKDYKELFDRFLNKQCSKDEAEELLQYFESEEGDSELVKIIESKMSSLQDYKDDLTADDYKVIHAIKGKLLPLDSSSKLKKMRKWLPYVAAISLFFFGLSWLLLDYSTIKDSLWSKESNIDMDEILATGNQAILQLSDGSIINLDDSQTGILVEEEGIIYDDGNSSKNPISGLSNKANLDTLILKTPRGNTYYVKLQDGTKVWLNAESTLKYPMRFEGKERVVYLEGEAFFEVVPKSIEVKSNTRKSKEINKHPFKVISKGQVIEVLGTKFNVSAYNIRKQIYTTLVEGKVGVDVKNKSERIFLSPGEQAISSEGGVIVRQIDVEPFIAWKEGYFHFDNELPQIAMAELARWYDLDIEYKGKVSELRLFGIIDRKKPLGSVLKSLENCGLSFNIEKSGNRHKLIILGEK